MAYIGDTADGGNYYNVNFAVGSRSPNKRDDVLLVQWLLHRVYLDHPFFSSPDGGDIAVDGFIGKQTIQWITAFQTDVRRLGQPCALDGRVDSARKSAGSISKSPYTILWLNAALRSANPAVFEDPGSDPEMPTELMSALQSNDASSGPFVETVDSNLIPATGGI
jgi:hypothetical protein